MIPTDKLLDYSVSDNIQMANQVKEFIEIFDEVSQKILAVKQSKVKPDKNMVRDNAIFINPKIKREFLELATKEMPFKDIVSKYEEWFEELYRLTVVNETWLFHSKVMNHLTEIYAICSSFQEILDKAKEGFEKYTPPPSPNKPTKPTG